jgi:hypothetical protein
LGAFVSPPRYASARPRKITSKATTAQKEGRPEPSGASGAGAPGKL